MAGSTLSVPRRRYAILAEGAFGELSSKTALGVIRYGRDAVVAVIDSSKAGRNVSEWLGEGVDIPVVASLDDALANRPDSLLIGIAPPGGRIPTDWRATIGAAIAAGLDVVSGLHEFIGDDAELAAAAAARGTAIIDHRRPPSRMEVARGREHGRGKFVVLTVGSDCAIGKMSVALELRRAALAQGLAAAFVPTGQTGIMIDGWGVAVDRVISDFVQGTVEWLVEQGERMGDWVIVEGQGSIDHPAYSSVTLGIIHGARPHAMVLVHEPGREFHDGWQSAGSRTKPLADLVRLHEEVAGLVAPSTVAAIALNTSRLAEGEARRLLAQATAETGLVADDPVRFGADRLLDALRAALP
ncbi:MAG TPA: DUF1611 domain-containing protein [Candidatus Caenarcaniphilales bacterium]|nr:DUF1611 domain-containing protein [Candidatus Caenarcaniphilales bacterium]